MTKEMPHICVCICTFRRPDLLHRLLCGLDEQETGGLFTYSVVVVDNDELQSAEAVVSNFAATSRTAVRYCVEPQQNIALARNTAVANAAGDFVAFIDDDEFPTKNWLLTLYTACGKYEADGVLGPVKPHFDQKPPQWIVKGKFYDRPSYPTGLIIDGKKGRTGNVLLKRQLFAAAGVQPFRPQFRTGEDQDFFSRMIELGYQFIWCHEAMAYEVVPPVRWKRSFMLRRALLNGGSAVLRKSFGPVEIAKSFIAVPMYTLVLPFALLLGHHRFMSILIKLCDHLGKLLALPHLNPMREPYITD
jgi:glycosyltransferase involved in cell wall biosynthesis